MLYLMKCFILLTIIISATGAHLRDKAKQIYVGSLISLNALQSEIKYKTIADQEFNSLVIVIIWDSIEPTRGHIDFSAADAMLAYAQQNNMTVRGSTLIWRYMPGWVYDLEDNSTELMSAMKHFITEVVTHFKGKVYAWDVLNEVLNDNGTPRITIWSRVFGMTYVAEALRAAHAADPDARLYINDYNLESKGKKFDTLLNLVKDLKAKDVPIHGVGLQGHFRVGKVSEDLADNMKSFTDIGVDVAITEMDVQMELPSDHDMYEQQAKDYTQVFNTCLSLPRCVGITVWGFTDKYSWIDGSFPGWGDACLWDKDYNRKPAVDAIEKILK